MEKLKQWAINLKFNLVALYLSYKDKRISWWVRVFTIIIVAYAFSPVDLIPDFIPLFGYLDDLIIVPLGIYFSLKMIPKDIFNEYLLEARKVNKEDIPRNWFAGILVIIVWVFVILEVFDIFII